MTKYITCGVCNRVLREEDGPICCFCLPLVDEQGKPIKIEPASDYPETDKALKEKKPKKSE